jgi:hypothetical protein
MESWDSSYEEKRWFDITAGLIDHHRVLHSIKERISTLVRWPAMDLSIRGTVFC